MFLILQGYEIEARHLNIVDMGYDKEVYFSGRALDKDGKEIHEALSKFKKGEVIDVSFERKNHDLWEGICEIVEIDLPTPDNVAPMIFRFSGKLKPVY